MKHAQGVRHRDEKREKGGIGDNVKMAFDESDKASEPEAILYLFRKVRLYHCVF